MAGEPALGLRLGGVVLAVVVVLGGSQPCLAQAQAPATVRDAVVRYPSGDRQVTLECFVPTTLGRHPTVLLLHGSGGLEGGTGEVFRASAAAMARNGYVALVPHLFEKTGHSVGDPWQADDDRAMLAAVQDALTYAATQPEVDADRFALAGFSMGSGLALTLAVRDPRIKAVASWSGAYPPPPPDPKLPPLLILHGAKDAGAPVKTVQAYADALKAAAMPSALHIYKGVGHNFDVERFEDATVRTVAFFNRYVKAPKRPR